ncbi:hypothetical protein CFPU101_45680 [Chroococcus sp. FPU101]|nr:hypothetical protein CFPU101_45680 [Chroococcus sp. FPU101]
MIHCRHTEANPIDYIFRGLDNLGFGLWAEQADAFSWSQAKRSEWKQQREQEKQAISQRYQRSLSLKERDKEIRKILKQLTLSDSHREQLKNRGFTDSQIEAANYRSVTQWQKLDFSVSNRLAGTNKRGLGLITPNGGILIPIPDVNGLYVGFQLRKDNLDDGNKYIWLSNEAKSTKLPNGELPIAVYKPSQVSDDGIVGLTEGTGFKPYLTSLRLGIPVIGAAGGNFASSSAIFKESLEQLGAKRVILFPDGGSFQNNNVLSQYIKVFDLLKSWNYQIDVAWWEQLQKSDGDIDEISNDKLKAIAYLSVDEFLAFSPNQKPTQDKLISKNRWTFKKLVSQLTEKANRIKPVGFGKTEPTELLPIESKKYQKCDRLQTWLDSEAKNLLDVSGTGLGKSFDAGRLTVDLFDGEIDRIIYVTNDPRNVTTPSLKDWPVVQGRHNGLTRSNLGEIRRRKNNDQPLIVEPNCYRPKTLAVLASKNIKDASDQSVVCRGCLQFELCSMGKTYDYIHQRRELLKNEDRLVIHPSSLSDSIDSDYSRTLIFWEESENSFNTTKTVKVTEEDVNAVIVAVSEDLELAAKINPFLNRLKKLFKKKQPRFGWSGKQLKDELKLLLPSDLDYNSLAGWLRNDLEKLLDPVNEYGEKIADLPRQVRNKFSVKDDDLADVVKQEVIKDWLFHCLDALDGRGYLNMANGELTISYPDERLTAIAHSAYKNIFLSATEFPKNLEARLGESVEVIECESPEINNITYTQVIDLGKLGQQRGKRQVERVKAIIDYIRETKGKENVAVISPKRHSSDDPDALNHFVHSQGTNAVEGKSTLIVDGLPMPNLEAIKHNFAVIMGKDPDEDTDSFSRYYQHRVNSLVKQEIGRLRASRYPKRQFEVIVLSNHDLSWLGEVNQVKAKEITPDAETKNQRTIRLIREAVTQLTSEGKKVTQTAVSFLTGYSQQHISRFKKLLILLIESFKVKCVKNSSGDEPPKSNTSELEYLGKTFLPLAENDQLLEEFGSLLSIYSQSDWLILWEFIPDETRVNLLTQIFALCEVLS